MKLGKQRHELKYLAMEHFYINNGWSISWMCRQLGIARAAFYKWKHRIIPQQERENQEIAELIKEYDERFSHILGYRRMTDWINHFNQTHFSRKRIHRKERENQEIAELIKEYDERFSHILGYRRMTDWINHFNQTHFSRKRIHRKKKKKYNTSKAEETAENKLARDFYASAPNQKWATDVTEFKIPETGKKLRFLKREKSYTSVQFWIFMIGIQLHLLLEAEMIIR